MKRCWYATVVAAVLAFSGVALAQAKPAEKPKVADWKNGEKVEVKWGGLWSAAAIVNQRGEWYLIEYTDGAKRREWVEHWRIRKVGDTGDVIGYARPNPVWRVGDEPPRKEVGEPPAPVGRAARDAQQDAAKAQFKNDAAFREADWSGARELDLVARPGQLEMAVDAAAKGPNPRPVRLEGANRDFFASVKGIAFSRGAGSFAAIIHENAPPGRAAEVKLEKVDLAKGRSAGVYELAAKMAVLDLSADGKLAALRSDEFGSGKSSRLEILALDGGQMKRVLVMYPYEKESWAPDQDVSGAWLVDGGQVITVNRKGKLALWEMVSGKAMYTAEVENFSRPGLSAGGKQMAIEGKGIVAIVEPSSGKVLAVLQREGRGGMSYSFSPSGEQLAGHWGRDICVWDLKAGELYREFTVAVSGSNLDVVGDGYALLDNRMLIDFERRIPLWNYAPGGQMAGAVAPNGVLWYSIKGSEGFSVLNGARLPTAEALAEARKLNAEELLLLKPGVKVALSVNVDVAEADREAVTASLKNQIAQKRLVLDDAAPIRIVASNEPGKPTEVEYRPIGARPFAPAQKVSVTPTITKLVIEVDGKPAWETRTASGAGFFLNLKEGQTIEQAVAEASKPNAAFLRNARLPGSLTKPKEPAWYGTSPLQGAR